MQRRQMICGALAALLAPYARLAVGNETAFPHQALRLIVPGGPGGVIDNWARWVSARLERVLKQPVVVENKPGAGGNIGTSFGAKSAPDGYTLTVMHQGTMVFNRYLYKSIGYEPLTDFAPVAFFGMNPLLLAASPALAVKNVSDLVNLARTKPTKLNFGSPGNGTPPHIAAELFKRAAGIDAIHVPYKSGGELLAALLGNQLDFSIDGLITQLPQAVAGRIRPLAVTGTKRLESLPGVPTMAEVGLRAAEFLSWTGIAAPANTPKPIVEQLNRAVASILASEEARQWLKGFEAEAPTSTPSEVAEFIRKEDLKWGPVIRETGLRLD